MNKISFLVFLILFSRPFLVYAQDTSQDINTDYVEDFTRANTNNVEQPEEEENRTFPLFRINFDADFLLRNRSPGTNFSASVAFDTGWAMSRLNLSEEISFGAADSLFITDASGYFHLLAVGISDFLYRKYLVGHETRMLGGFSYTKHVRDVLRVDVNLGLSYFDISTPAGLSTTQYGFQIGTRILVNYFRIHNELFISGYQNVKLGDAGVDLSGTRLSCSVEPTTIDCIVPPGEEDPGSYSGVNIISWQTAGLLIEENMFVNLYETEAWQIGPSLVIRYENLPIIGTRVRVLVGVRATWVN